MPCDSWSSRNLVATVSHGSCEGAAWTLPACRDTTLTYTGFEFLTERPSYAKITHQSLSKGVNENWALCPRVLGSAGRKQRGDLKVGSPLPFGSGSETECEAS